MGCSLSKKSSENFWHISFSYHFPYYVFRIIEICNCFIRTFQEKDLRTKIQSLFCKYILFSKKYLFCLYCKVSGWVHFSVIHQQKRTKIKRKRKHHKNFFLFKIIFLTWNTAIVNTRVTITCNKLTTRETKKCASANWPGETPVKKQHLFIKKLQFFWLFILIFHIYIPATQVLSKSPSFLSIIIIIAEYPNAIEWTKKIIIGVIFDPK